MAFLHNHLEIRFAIILFKLHEILRKIIKVVATRCDLTSQARRVGRRGRKNEGRVSPRNLKNQTSPTHAACFKM